MRTLATPHQVKTLSSYHTRRDVVLRNYLLQVRIYQSNKTVHPGVQLVVWDFDNMSVVSCALA